METGCPHLVRCRVDVALLAHDDVGQMLVLPRRRRRRLNQEPVGKRGVRAGTGLGASLSSPPLTS